VVEAMACGAPVITGRVAALNEVTADAAECVDPLDVETLGEALVSLTRSRERREELARRGLDRARGFSWERAAAETLAVYRLAAADAVTSRAATPAALQS
jgi:glycosyltransferase involved in cell wall biosynthesis